MIILGYFLVHSVSDPWRFGTDPDPWFFSPSFFAYKLPKVHLHQSQNCRNQFFLILCLLIEGSWSGSVQIIMNSDSGSPKLTDPVQGANSSWSTKRKFIQEGGFMVTDTELEKKGTHIITDQNSEAKFHRHRPDLRRELTWSQIETKEGTPIIIDRNLKGNSPHHRPELKRELTSS
jgi:hypothetical protein